MNSAPPPKPKKRWRILRRCAHGVWMIVLLLALLLITACLYVNEIGLPSFAKQKVVDAVRAQGVDLQFSRLRWHFYRGIVVDNVRIGPADPAADAPQISAREVAVKLNHAGLRRFKLRVDSLIVRGGQVVWALPETNQPPELLAVTNIQTQLQFLTNNQWQLDHFSAGFAGAKMMLSGSITNASAVRDWNIFRGHGTPPPELLRRRLRELAQAVDNIHFTKPPELNVSVHGDARDTHSFDGIITLNAPDANTPWGSLTNATLLVRLVPPVESNGLSRVEFQINAAEVTTPWGNTTHFLFDLHAAGDDQLTNLIQARVDISARRVSTPWAQAANAHIGARWTHSLTNPVPNAGTGELRLTDATTRWGTVADVRLRASLSTPTTNGPPRADASWAWWAKFEPYFLDWNCRLQEVRAEDFESKEVLFGGSWRAPELTITNLHTEMYQGQLNAAALLNVATRAASFSLASDFDAQKVYPFLNEGGQKWWRDQAFAWEKPPVLHGSGSVILPAWTNRHPDWRGEVQPTLLLRGDFAVGAASFRQAQVLSAQSHLIYSNRVWNLPDLVATRPEGRLELALTSDDKTKDYYVLLRSTVDLKLARTWMEDPKAREGFDRVIFTQPPLVEAEIWGRWHELDRLGLKALVTASNFTFRGESADYFHGTLAYTNRFLTLSDARLERATNQVATVGALGVDFDRKRAFLTNGFSTLDPGPLVRAIGPKIADLMSPYHFLQPPTATVNGVIPLSDDTSMADLHFQLAGGPYEWMKFHSSHVAGTINWVGDSMTIDGVKADFYGGKLTGTAGFNFSKEIDGADFNFDLNVTRISLQALLADISSGTNHPQGTVSGNLIITRANTHDPKSWFGKGHADLSDGLIWEIPIFGVLSDVLEKSLGVGKSRLSEGTADFIITNSVIRSDNLQLRSSTVRLFYRGTVDFDTKVDAMVDADVGQDTPLVGDVLGLLSRGFGKLFETRVTGTLADPKRQLDHWIPRILIEPFLHPFRTIKDTFVGESSSKDNPPVVPGPLPTAPPIVLPAPAPAPTPTPPPP